MPIRIGNQTFCHAPAHVPYQFALRHGFDAFEWFSDPGYPGWCEDDFDIAERKRLRDEGRAKGVVFSVHAPHMADPVTPEGKADLLRSIRFAADIGAAVVNLHLFARHSGSVFAESLRPLVGALSDHGILTLENTPETSPEAFNAVFTAIAKMPDMRNRIGMCLDSGHANLFPGTHHDYIGFVDRLGDHVPIRHWHAHENWGDRDSHLPLFTGPSAQNPAGLQALVSRLQARGFAGSVVLEQWPNPPEILVETRRRLDQLWQGDRGEVGSAGRSASSSGSLSPAS